MRNLPTTTAIMRVADIVNDPHGPVFGRYLSDAELLNGIITHFHADGYSLPSEDAALAVLVLQLIAAPKELTYLHENNIFTRDSSLQFIPASVVEYTLILAVWDGFDEANDAAWELRTFIASIASQLGKPADDSLYENIMDILDVLARIHTVNLVGYDMHIMV